MAQPLTTLEIFDKYAYTTITEMLRQKIDLWNSATRGAFMLQAGANQGDYSFAARYKDLGDLVVRRDPKSEDTVSALNLEHLKDVSVKVGGMAKPVRIDPGDWQWIQRSPEEAAVVIGQQLAPKMLSDMLNTGISSLYAAMSNDTDTIAYDGSAAGLSLSSLIAGKRLFGDQADDIKVWVTHSQPAFDFLLANATNTANLFEFGNFAVMNDGMGTIIIKTDSDSLVTEDGVESDVDEYHVLGLTPGALMVEQNNDFLSNVETKNGYQNIQRTLQHQWSYNLGIKSYAWDVSSGGPAPTNATLASSANWNRLATSYKDLPGVIVNCRLAADV